VIGLQSGRFIDRTGSMCATGSSDLDLRIMGQLEYFTNPCCYGKRRVGAGQLVRGHPTW
jgi:hypothetical protein